MLWRRRYQGPPDAYILSENLASALEGPAIIDKELIGDLALEGSSRVSQVAVAGDLAAVVCRTIALKTTLVYLTEELSGL